MYFPNFIIISPWKRAGPSFEKTWMPFTQGYFVPNFVEIGPVVLEKKMKSLWQQQGRQRQRKWWQQTSDKFWSEKLTWVFGSAELKKLYNLEFKKKNTAITCVPFHVQWWTLRLARCPHWYYSFCPHHTFHWGGPNLAQGRKQLRSKEISVVQRC